jgi:hypothetical protein
MFTVPKFVPEMAGIVRLDFSKSLKINRIDGVGRGS